MAISNIKVPALPESIADATVAAWHKKPGDFVKRDENIVDLETDKVVLEVPALEDGILKEILKPVGSTVLASEILGTFEAGASNSQVDESKKGDQPVALAPTPISEPTPLVTPTETETKSVQHLSPSVKRAVQEGRVNLENIVQAKRSSVSVGERIEKRVPMTRLRQRIAERLLEAKNNTAMLTTFNEVNLQAVMDLRQKYKDVFEKKHGARLGFMSFFTLACVEALKRFPSINASIDGTDVVYHNYFDIGMAISTERGLVVPIVRDADQLSMAEIELKIVDFAKRARDGKLSLEELTGGTFSITNGGVFGSLLSTPIINPPQSAILGMHTIQQRPVAENGQVVIRPMMYLALSYDHRIVDGKEAISFLVAIKENLEYPSRQMLGI
ncbi:MAG: 2-oxoglutarate dehydrogenase complex dihydrolipoyllysine-residue succinyltransferase [Gammaproteobacteria bacterium]|nr:2-oxoglutarate dehydrogenase complex dihydrolipoyllysine-residue succinyltransferase [Gammaproteobacteria bacterium]